MQSKPELKADRFLRLVGKSSSWPLGQRLTVAVVLVLLATLLRIVLTFELGDRFIYVSYFPAVAVAAMVTGVAGGILATLLSVIAVNFGFDAEHDLGDLIRAIGFVAAAAVVVGLAWLVEMSRDRLTALEDARLDEERQRQFIEQAPVALAMFDEEMRYIAISRRWREDYHLGNADIIGRSHYEVFPEIQEGWRAIHQRGLSGEVIRAEEDLLRRMDGQQQWGRWEVRPWYRDGGVAGIIIFSEDITERKKIEKQFGAAQRMEAVGQLAGGIAHDFNNLLAVITGNLELIEQRSDNEEIRELVRPALDAARAGAAFNRRLLSISGKRSSGQVSFVANDRIRDLSVLLERIFNPHALLKFEMAGDLWRSIADEGELDSAVINLVINSRDAMPQGGEIIVRTRNVSLDAARIRGLPKEAHEGDYVCISVTDNGEGMSPELLEHAMEPFFTTKSIEGGGTGLGLSSVRNFVLECGGFITIESRKRDGTCVSLFLPRAPAERHNEGQSPKRDEISLGNGECVLVVEDDQRVREVTLRRIEALGYVAESARSGSEAIALLKSGVQVDLVLSDIAMPAMSGFDLARQIRLERSEVKIVFATGYIGEPLTKDDPLSNIPLLHKPYTREQLASALAEALGRRVQIRETSLAKT